VTDLYVQTADDLVPLLGDMDPKVGVSTLTLVSRGDPLQKAAKLPQYVAAVSGNVVRLGVVMAMAVKTTVMSCSLVVGGSTFL
jgi:uncharacterized Zn-binding protein involved in type VI secretion